MRAGTRPRKSIAPGRCRDPVTKKPVRTGFFALARTFRWKFGATSASSVLVGAPNEVRGGVTKRLLIFLRAAQSGGIGSESSWSAREHDPRGKPLPRCARRHYGFAALEISADVLLWLGGDTAVPGGECAPAASSGLEANGVIGDT